MHRIFRLIIPLVLLLAGLNRCEAFNPPEDESAGFRVEIQAPTKVEVAKGIFTAGLKLANKSEAPASLVCEVYGTDGWKVLINESGKAQCEFPLAPSEVREVSLQVHPASDSVSGPYPLHVKATVRGGKEEVRLHAIAILQAQAMTKVEAKGRELALVVPRVPLQLMRYGTDRVEIVTDQGTAVSLAGGWSGSEQETGTSISFDPLVDRAPKAAPAIGIHPPFRLGPGRARLTWRVRLPQETPITLDTAFAIRDTHAPEPDSDGVTYRVFADGQSLLDRHSASHKWDEARIDLSRYAGKEIDLSLESDVGPNRNSVCDQSYWRQPWILAGAAMPETQAEEPSIREARLERACKALTAALSGGGGTPVEEEAKVFIAGEGETKAGLAVLSGPHGLFDAAWATGVPGKVVAFDGFELALEGSSPLDPLSGCILLNEEWQGGQCRVDLTRENQRHWVSLNIRTGDQGFELKWDSDLPLTDLSAGRFSAKVGEVYAGVGNVLKAPLAPFTLEADGHRLATRHVGLRFEDGLSLVMACSNPPDRLVVDPDRGLYALHTHLPGSFYIIPSAISAFDAAIKYRGMIDLKPGPGVPQLAGRFSFDVWGGGYAGTADAIETAAKYGLTHSLLVFHNWQRWGYDYRLPDIYPPNPRFGSLDDMKRLREVCRKHGILFAPHDNYIDIYPDCDEFSYDLVCFFSGGTPWNGWYNEGRKAQAYRFRPDKYIPFLERNVRLMCEGFAPDAFFIDVFSSAGAFDYWDKDGGFHDMNETIRYWVEGFARAREIMGGNAPQISESGTDWLIGELDGAQCNHIGVGKDRAGFSWYLECADNERVPWQDAVVHDVFILQGVGYPYRFAGGQDVHLHGTHSDDYLSAEILTGHPPMVDTAFSRAAVRKYWLLHDFLNEVAAVPITSIEFEGGDIHRQKVVYANGAKVWVNRGEEVWSLPDGHRLPRYGFWAAGPAASAGILESAGGTIEEATSSQFFYADGRGVDCQTLQAAERAATDFGWCRTNAGVRLARETAGVTVTPLPSSPAARIELRVEALGLPAGVKVRAELPDGSTAEVKAESAGGFLSWEIDPAHFRYRVGGE